MGRAMSPRGRMRHLPPHLPSCSPAFRLWLPWSPWDRAPGAPLAVRVGGWVREMGRTQGQVLVLTERGICISIKH